MSRREERSVQFVAEGPELAAETEQYQEAVARIAAEIDAIYSSQINAASRARGLVLRWQRRRELARRLKELLPDDALFASSSSR